jgi:hypothetical protein
MDSFLCIMPAWSTRTPMTVASMLNQLWRAHSHNSDKLPATTLTSSHLKTWLAYLHNWYSCSLNSEIVTCKALTCTVSPLCHAWSHHSDMLTITCLTISLCWKQAGSGGSVIADWGETRFAGSNLPIWQSEFAGSKLVTVDVASLVGVKLPSLVAVDPALQVEVELASRGGSWWRWIRLPW